MGKLMINGEQYPAIVVKAGLDDTQTRKDATWSSDKINEELDDVRGELDIIVEEANKNTTINDEVTSLTTTWSSKKTSDELATKKDAVKLLNNATDSTKWLKLKLGNSSTFQPIIVSDQYGGKVEINGMADEGTYKSVKKIRYSYGDWTTYSATDYTLYDGVDPNYKIQRLFYYLTDGYYYLEIRQWATIKVEGNSTAELVTSLPAATSEMTLIPESQFATKKDIDGTTFKTTTTTGSEYYAITFKDKQFERGNNQGILIQHNRLNFEPVTFIFSASSYNTTSYERDNYDVTKINGATYNSTSPYMMHFYMDKTNNTLYLSVPSYSGVTLMDLQFKSDVIIYIKVDAIPDTATKITVTEYASISDTSTNTISTWSSSKIASEIGRTQIPHVGTSTGWKAEKDLSSLPVGTYRLTSMHSSSGSVIDALILKTGYSYFLKTILKEGANITVDISGDTLTIAESTTSIGVISVFLNTVGINA